MIGATGWVDSASTQRASDIIPFWLVGVVWIAQFVVWIAQSSVFFVIFLCPCCSRGGMSVPLVCMSENKFLFSYLSLHHPNDMKLTRYQWVYNNLGKQKFWIGCLPFSSRVMSLYKIVCTKWHHLCHMDMGQTHSPFIYNFFSVTFLFNHCILLLMICWGLFVSSFSSTLI